jgi:hypothetical protein
MKPGKIVKLCFNLAEILKKKFNFPQIICIKSELSAEYTAERHAFPQNKLWKVKTFSIFYLGKFSLFNEYLSHIKTKF